jgi:leucyl/phenylalanyl-tRNA--protein transferase
MALESGEIAWFSPDPRGIIPLNTFHVPHGLRRIAKKGIFEVKIDTAFEEVVRACAERSETWISEQIVQSYLNLYGLGFAHSVEAWKDQQLAGGLYGVSIQGAFFGESMFHRETDASKIALMALVDRLQSRGFTLLDTQYITPHLRNFGAIEVSKRQYLRMLHAGYRFYPRTDGSPGQNQDPPKYSLGDKTARELGSSRSQWLW